MDLLDVEKFVKTLPQDSHGYLEITRTEWLIKVKPGVQIGDNNTQINAF